ncbi:MAG: T9SS type A sorting domain-containing protein [Bacteroidetes bacterium]|nr:T9SS type A sorting domain-containing protein [Bacteroidota bacterium]
MTQSIRSLLFLFLLTFIYSAGKTQNIWFVSDAGDNGVGTLRNLISSANDGDTIKFAESIDTGYLTSGELLIDKSLSIIGNDVCIIRDTINTVQFFRIINISDSVTDNTVFFQGLQFLYGRTREENIDIEPGAGIYIANGTLLMKDCMVKYNKTGDGKVGEDGDDGGGIYNCGNLIMNNCDISNNRAGNGGIGIPQPPDDTGGDGGNGGAIYNRGNLHLIDCTINFNNAGHGGYCYGQYHSDAEGGEGGCGGAVYNTGELLIERCFFSNNSSGNGGGAGGDFSSLAKDGGKGGVIINFGVCNLLLSALSENFTGKGGDGGGAVYVTVHGNGGDGGAISNHGVFKAINCLMAGNQTGIGGHPTYSRSGNGGGIFCADNTISLINCTIAKNRCSSNDDKIMSGRLSSIGGGVQVDNGQLNLDNTIIALNLSESHPEGDDLSGTGISDYSLITCLPEGNLSGQGNLIGIYPLFVNDTNYRLSSNSPAINTGNPDTSDLNLPPVDLDSLPRILQNIDMGAYEYQYPISSGRLMVYPDTLVIRAVGGQTAFIDSIFIKNIGEGNLTIFSVLSEIPFEIKRAGQTGWGYEIEAYILPPNESDTVMVRFYPPDTGYYFCDINVNSNDPDFPLKTVYVKSYYYACHELSGTIEQDSTLTGCVYITGNVIVPNGVTLYVEPGCTVKFDGKYNLVINGKILALGSLNDKITFTGIMPWESPEELENWSGILIHGTSPGHIDTAVFNHCIFEYANPGPAVDISEYAHVRMSNSLFRFNAGGISCYSSVHPHDFSDPLLVLNNSIFHNNIRGSGGGVFVYYSVVSNVLFYNNVATGTYHYDGGGGAAAFYSTLMNCTFAKNIAYEGDGITGERYILRNSVFYDDWPYWWEWGASITYSCGKYYGFSGNNIDADPLLVDPANNDFRLSSASPCIDSGDPDTTYPYFPEYDLDFHPRIYNNRVDIGAYEYQIVSPPQISIDTDEINFNNCPLLVSKIDSLLVYNLGTDLLILDSVTVPEGYDIKQANGSYKPLLKGVEIIGNQYIALYIRFLPEEGKEYNGYITIYSNDPEEPVSTVYVSGYGVDGYDEIDPLQVKIYPNPTGKKLVISSPYLFTSVELIDTQGKTYISKEGNKNFNITLDVNFLNSGVYVLKLRSKYQVINKKVIMM